MKLSALMEIDRSLVMIYPENYHENNYHEEILGIATLETPKAGHLLFIKDQKFYHRWQQQQQQQQLADRSDNATTFSKMGVVCSNSFLSKGKGTDVLSLLRQVFSLVMVVDQVELSMAILSYPFYREKNAGVNWTRDGRASGTAKVATSAAIADKVFIGEHSQIAENVQIMAGAVIGPRSHIGAGTIIYSNVSIYPWVKIGKNCIIHANSTIGADGFGYTFDKKQLVHRKIWHVGGVIIGDEVEIGASSTVDSGTFSPTVIGEGTKIDNGVQIAHNCKIGKGVIICGQVGLSGSAQVGDYTVMGGRSGIGPNIKVGRECQVAGGAMVSCDWEDKSVLAGHPARPLNEWMRGLAYVREQAKLPRSKALSKSSSNFPTATNLVEEGINNGIK